MTPRKRKWLLAGATAATGAAADVAAQMVTGQLINAPRSVVVGLVVGAVTRIVGALLSTIAMDESSDGSTG